MPEVPVQELGLALSLAAFIIISVALVLARLINGGAPPSLRLAMLGLWLYAALRLYSAFAYLWDASATDLAVIRMVVVAVMTMVVIVGLTLLAYYWRRWRSGR